MKLWYKKYSGCEKKRLAHFFQAAMHHYYELCLKGESYDVAYTQTSYSVIKHLGSKHIHRDIEIPTCTCEINNELT